LEKLHFYIDETKFKKDAKLYLGLSLVIIRNDENIDELKEELNLLKKELELDQFLGHDKDDRLLHFTEDSLEIKPKVIDKIRPLPIKAYIAYTILENDSEFKRTYLEILKKLLFDRINKNKQFNIHIFYEEQSQIKQNDVQQILDTILTSIDAPNCTISKTTKENVLICLPDYILGVFRDITDTEKKSQDYMKRNYGKLNSKIRLIIDMENHIFYSTKNPYPIS